MLALVIVFVVTAYPVDGEAVATVAQEEDGAIALTVLLSRSGVPDRCHGHSHVPSVPRLSCKGTGGSPSWGRGTRVAGFSGRGTDMILTGVASPPPQIMDREALWRSGPGGPGKIQVTSDT
jgi:hypothetical protein